MIELGYNFDKKLLDKIKRYKNSVINISKNEIKKVVIIKYF